MFSFGTSTFYYLHIFLVSFAIFVILFFGWGCVTQYRQGAYSRILAFLTVMIIIYIFLTYSFVLILTLASHPPLGESDHMVVSVDVKFVVKSTNEHPYHRTVYSYSKADWDGLRDHLRDVPWLDIFKHDTTYVAKEITEWVEIGIDCCIPHRNIQLKPHSSPCFTPCAVAIAHRNHYFHQDHRNATPDNKKLFCDSPNHRKKVLNRGTSTIPLFNDPEVLPTSTDKVNLFARNLSCNSTLNDGTQQLPNFLSRTEQRLSSNNITAKMVSRAIHDLDASKATGLVFHHVGNLHRLCQFLKMMERDLIQVSIIL